MKKPSVKEQVKTILHQQRGSYYSGQELAEQIGVSRTAVWKAINCLRQEGYEICGSTKIGYAMSLDTDLLEVDEICRQLPKQVQDFYQIKCFETIDSTNEEAKRQSKEFLGEGLCLVSMEQTAGKGRRGRTFYSPSHTGLYLSILLRPDMKVEEAVFITTAAAVAGAKACETVNPQCGKNSIGIKWVNDLYLNQKKICGILTEGALSLEAGKLEYAIMGIGFNLSPPKEGWPQEIESIAGSLFEKEYPSGTRNKLVSSFLMEFYEIYKQLPQVAYLEEYKRRQLAIGKDILIQEADGKTYKAHAYDVNEKCQLMVQYEGQTELQSLSTGEISIRLNN